MQSPHFITFEGIDGCGKTTQLQLLCDAFYENAIDYVRTREPGGTDGANAIRKLLVEGEPDRWDGVTETLLHYAARRDHIRRVVEPSLKEGKWVICDRFADSTVAYQGFGHSISLGAIHQLNEFVVGDTKPHLTFLFDIDAETALSRASRRDGKEDRYEKMNLAFHQRVRDGFLEIAQMEPRFVILDAKQSVRELHQQVLHHLAIRFGVIVPAAKAVGTP